LAEPGSRVVTAQVAAAHGTPAVAAVRRPTVALVVRTVMAAGATVGAVAVAAYLLNLFPTFLADPDGDIDAHDAPLGRYARCVTVPPSGKPVVAGCAAP